MALLPTLLLAHLIADFPLQTDGVFRFKNRSAFGIWLHVSIHLIVTASLIEPYVCGIKMLVTLGLLHFCCDWFKIHYTDENRIVSFLGDQLAHIIILIFCAQFFADVEAVYGSLLIFPALVFVAIPSLAVLLFVLGHDLASRGIQQPQLVAWSMVNGLNISHYFSGPLLAMLLLTLLL